MYTCNNGSNRTLRRRLACTAGLAALIALGGLPALAQAEDPPAETVGPAAEVESRQSTITVTGSRIPVDPNLVASGPVQSLSEQAFRLSGEVGIGEIVNDVPALISSTTGENSATGANALNLRGLGTERTLTLVNGRRHVGGFEGDQSVDVGSIPSALIERVEVLTGGASAVYGSDAVTGVVNFILKRDFEGIDFDISTGLSGQGDAGYLSAKFLAGSNFDNDRGNVVFALDIVDDSDLRFGDRDWAANNSRARSLSNPALRFQDGDIGAGTPNFAQFYNFANTGRFPYGLAIPTQQGFISAYTSAFGSAPSLTAAETALLDRRLNSPSRLIAPQPTFSISSNRGVIAPGDFGLANLDVNSNGVDDCLDSFVGWNSTLVGTGSFGLAGGCWVVNDDGTVRPYQDGQIAGNFNAFGGDGIQDDFNQNFLLPETDNYVINLNSTYELVPGHRAFVEAKFASTTSNYGGPLNTFYDLLYGAPENPFLPAQLQGVANDTGGLYITRDPTDLGPNIDKTKRDTIRIVAGVEGDFKNGWGYEISVNRGEFRRDITDNNYVLLDRFFAAIDVVSDPVTGAPICRSDIDSAIYPTTIFGIPAFDPGYFTFSPGDGQCKPANIWAGPNSISDEAVNFITTTVKDKLELTQTVLSAQLVGDSSEYFKLPAGPIGFAGGVEFRREESKNSRNPIDRGVLPADTSFTPGILVSEVSGNGSLGFNAEGAFLDSEGSYSVTDVFSEIRIPILLDTPFTKELSLDGAYRYADYSTSGGAETWKVGATWAPVQDITFRGTVSQAIRAPNISELFGPDNPATFRPIDPCDVTEIPNAPDPAVRAANCLADGLPANFLDPLSARFLGVSGGNADLEPETADTQTLGVVFQPRFLPGFSLTVDYWDVSIEDVILAVSDQDIVNNCYDSPGFPNAFCGLFTRNRTVGSPQFGGLNFLRQTQINFAKIEATGYDFAAGYQFALGGNDFGARLVGSKQEKLDRFPDPSDPTFIDPEIGEIQRPEWAANLTLTWDRGPMSLGFRTQYQGEQALAGIEIEQIEAGTFSPENAIAEETYIFDMFGSFRPSDALEFYAGVNNIADEEPFITNEAWPVGPRGRFFFIGLRYRN